MTAQSIRTRKHKKLIKLLAQARIDHGIPQIELAKKLRRSQSYIARIEAGHRRIDVIELFEIAQFFKLDVGRLMAQVERGY